MERVEKKLCCVLAVVLSVFILGCSRHEPIVLVSQDGAHQLVYNADDFIPQARTTDDVRVLIDTAFQIMREDPKDAVTGASLRAAICPPPDYRQLERVIYTYKVAQL